MLSLKRDVATQHHRGLPTVSSQARINNIVIPAQAEIRGLFKLRGQRHWISVDAEMTITKGRPQHQV